MLRPLIGCYSFLGRNRQRPQSHHTPAKLMLPPVSQLLNQSPIVTHCLLPKVTYRLSIEETHRLPLKVADSLSKVTHCLLPKVTYRQLLTVAYCLPLKKEFPSRWQVSQKGNSECYNSCC